MAGAGDAGLVIVGIELLEIFGAGEGFLPFPEGGVGTAEDGEDLGMVGVLLADGGGEVERLLVVAFFEGDGGLEELGGGVVAKGFEADGEGFLRFIGESEVELGAGEGLGVVGALGVGVEAVFQEGEGSIIFPGVEVGAGEVPLVLAVGLGGGFGGVGGDFVDVAEIDELLEEGGAFFGAEGAALLAGATGVFPSGDGGDGPVCGEEFLEDAAFHVVADGVAEGVEDGGGDVEQAGAVDGFGGFLDAGAFGEEDALLAVPDGDAGGDARGELGPQVIGVEAVVGDEDDGSVRASHLKKDLEHHVVGAVGAFHDVLVDLEVLIGDACHLGGMVVHEVVGDFIDGAEVDGHEVPTRIGLHEMGGGGLDGVGLGHVLAEVIEAFVAGLVDEVAFGEEGLEDFLVDLVGGDAEFVHGFREILGPVGAGHGRGEVGGSGIRGGSFDMGEHVGDHLTVEVLLALGGEPTDDVGAQAFFAEHFPNGLTLAGGGGDGDDLAGNGIDFRESGHLVVVGHFPGGNGAPEHGRELRLEGGEIAMDAAVHERADAVHAAFREEIVDDFPVRGIPADEEDFAGCG